jgi:hypothetical protein
MSKIHIIPSELNQSLELQLAFSIRAGFPSLAEDYQEDNIIENKSSNETVNMWRTIQRL